MYTTAEIAMFMTRLFNEIDTSVGSIISIPQGADQLASVTKSVTFWSAWMRFKERTRSETDVRMHIEHFRAAKDPPQPIEHGCYATKDILAWAQKHPQEPFSMMIRYASRETAEKGINTFEAHQNLN